MIVSKLRDYVEVLSTLYGTGTYLNRIVRLHLTVSEADTFKRNLSLRYSPVDEVATRIIEQDSLRRSTSRLMRKIDGMILAHPVSSVASRPLAITREVYANLAAGSLALMTQSHSLGRQRLHSALRLATLPEHFEIRLLILRQLIRTCAKQSNTLAHRKYVIELERSRNAYDIITKLDEQFSRLLLQYSKPNKQHMYATLIAKDALPLLRHIDISAVDPAVVVAGCSLAAVVGQVLHDPELAASWMSAFPGACKKLRIWNKAYEVDWLLHQILLGQFFDNTSSNASYTQRLLELVRLGSTKWFELCRYLCEVAFRNMNFTLAANIAFEVVAHPRFRRQTVFLQKALIHRGLYAGIYANNPNLVDACLRKRKGRNVSSVHMTLFGVLNEFREPNVMNALTVCQHALDFLKVTNTAHRSRLRAELFTSTKALKKLDFVADSREQRRQFHIIQQQLMDAMHPIIIDLL